MFERMINIFLLIYIKLITPQYNTTLKPWNTVKIFSYHMTNNAWQIFSISFKINKKLSDSFYVENCFICIVWNQNTAKLVLINALNFFVCNKDKCS